MKYHTLFVILKKRQNLKLSSAANYRCGALRVNMAIMWWKMHGLCRDSEPLDLASLLSKESIKI